jgi:hypothetical protein
MEAASRVVAKSITKDGTQFTDLIDDGARPRTSK